MAGKDFSKMPLSYSGLLFRHIDRCSASLSRGMDVCNNVHLLTSYYGLVLHLEALLCPYHDQEYLRKAQEIERDFPGFGHTWQGLHDNMDFLKACNKWLKLLVALAFKKGLLSVAAGSWEEVEAETIDGVAEDASNG